MGESNRQEKGVCLAFFKEFLTATGSPYQFLSEKMGVSTAGIHHWFRIDDARLSQVMQAAEVLGYRLYVSISDEPSDVMEYEAMVRKDGLQPSTKRLHFLTCALKEEKMTKIQLAQLLGYTRDNITYWYGKDDITIQNLVKCAKALKRNLNYRFIKAGDFPALDRNKVSIRSSILIRGSWDVPTED